MKRIAVVVLVSAAMLVAADSEFVYWSGAQLKGYDKKLAAKMNPQKTATETLANFPDKSLLMAAHREADGEAELHQAMADFFIVQSGEATLVHGGQVVNGKTTAPDEIRGPSISGGEKQQLGPGDMVHIPAGMPHQLLVPAGKQFNYFVIKVHK
jgi:mannose-6-phosphate isomerase-like protein (cupin superfamily)